MSLARPVHLYSPAWMECALAWVSRLTTQPCLPGPWIIVYLNCIYILFVSIELIMLAQSEYRQTRESYKIVMVKLPKTLLITLTTENNVYSSNMYVRSYRYQKLFDTGITYLYDSFQHKPSWMYVYLETMNNSLQLLAIKKKNNPSWMQSISRIHEHLTAASH